MTHREVHNPSGEGYNTSTEACVSGTLDIIMSDKSNRGTSSTAHHSCNIRFSALHFLAQPLIDFRRQLLRSLSFSVDTSDSDFLFRTQRLPLPYNYTLIEALALRFWGDFVGRDSVPHFHSKLAYHRLDIGRFVPILARTKTSCSLNRGIQAWRRSLWGIRSVDFVQHLVLLQWLCPRLLFISFIFDAEWTARERGEGRGTTVDS